MTISAVSTALSGSSSSSTTTGSSTIAKLEQKLQTLEKELSAENQSKTRPSLAYINPKGYGYPNDNSYTRIKDITLSYTFPKAFLQKIKLQGLTAYASGKNIYTFTKWIGWDPESTQDARGTANWTNNYPFTRQIVFGLNVTLQ